MLLKLRWPTLILMWSIFVAKNWDHKPLTTCCRALVKKDENAIATFLSSELLGYCILPFNQAKLLDNRAGKDELVVLLVEPKIRLMLWLIERKGVFVFTAALYILQEASPEADFRKWNGVCLVCCWWFFTIDPLDRFFRLPTWKLKLKGCTKNG